MEKKMEKKKVVVKQVVKQAPNFLTVDQIQTTGDQVYSRWCKGVIDGTPFDLLAAQLAVEFVPQVKKGQKATAIEQLRDAFKEMWQARNRSDRAVYDLVLEECVLVQLNPALAMELAGVA